MIESIPSNELEVNQIARQKLREAGQEPDSSSLYLLQLATWRLSQQLLHDQVHPELSGALDQRLSDMEGLDPQRLMAEVFESPDLQYRLHPDQLRDLSPQEAGNLVLAVIHEEQMNNNLAWPGNLFPDQR